MPKGKGKRKAQPPVPPSSEQQQAQAEGLVLRVADNTTGYFGVCLANPGYPKPYHARVTRGGKTVSLGSFATAEEAALCVARSPKGQAAAQKAAAAPFHTKGMPRDRGSRGRIVDSRWRNLGGQTEGGPARVAQPVVIFLVTARRIAAARPVGWPHNRRVWANLLF